MPAPRFLYVCAGQERLPDRFPSHRSKARPALAAWPKLTIGKWLSANGVSELYDLFPPWPKIGDGPGGIGSTPSGA